jgi:L-asparaginase/Glu-tRNA(Gln) amidotransferase subunit D
MKRKVLFICHGGTIGMQLHDRNGKLVLLGPNSNKDFSDSCESSLKKFKENGIEITYEFITSKDSTNVNFEDWIKLTKRIEKARQEGFDGIAITHGTDTLPHTATALTLALTGINPDNKLSHLPIVITGAQNSIYTSGGDARFNLENLFATLIAAIEFNCSEVLISFYDRILRGCRTIKVSERRFDAMDSPAFRPVGIIDANGAELWKERLRTKTNNFPNSLDSLAAHWGQGVVTIAVSPGLEPSIIEHLIESKDVKALILECFGEGNVCNEGKYNLIPIIKKATEDKKIPVFLSSQFPGGNIIAAHYEPGQDAVAAGAIPCFDHTHVAVDVKVRWLIGNKLCDSISSFKQAMATSYAGEVSPPQ